jgi:YfiH family protein
MGTTKSEYPIRTVSFINVGTIRYYRFPSLDVPGLRHAIFTRHGGFSPSPWKSLNFGASVGDNVQRVKQNREKALEVLDISPSTVYDVYQVHSDKVVIAKQPLGIDDVHIKADAIITNQPKLTLLMRFADCVPILLYDPIRKVIGMAHAGWMGTVKKIAAKTALIMGESFGTKPVDLIAAIGPSVGPDHYPVGTDVVNYVRSELVGMDSQVIIRHDGKTYLDLWKANQLILNAIGVYQVEISQICTSCNLADWYSHRGEFGKTGRFGAVISLEG